jgi:hypothetical protein
MEKARIERAKMIIGVATGGSRFLFSFSEFLVRSLPDRFE